MSTYNGEKYIAEQIESIAAQKNVDVRLLIRDDSSKDRTLEIIEEYQHKYEWIDIVKGENLGAAGSFRDLVMSAPDSDYYAFADQDDIWYPEKLEKAIQEILSRKCSNILYVGNQNCVNSNGAFMYKRLPENYSQDNVVFTLLQNQYSGCTMVFDKEMIDSMRKVYGNMNQNIMIMHDICFLSVAQLTGNVVYDSDSYMDFRRHGSNYSEAELYENMNAKKKAMVIKHKFNSFRKNKAARGAISDYCKTLLETFPDGLTKEDEENLQYLTEYKSTNKKWFNAVFCNRLRIFYQKPKWNIILKFLFKIY